MPEHMVNKSTHIKYDRLKPRVRHALAQHATGTPKCRAASMFGVDSRTVDSALATPEGRAFFEDQLKVVQLAIIARQLEVDLDWLKALELRTRSTR